MCKMVQYQEENEINKVTFRVKSKQKTTKQFRKG